MNRLISIALVCLLQVSLAVASTFNLRVEVTPNGAGSLNTSGGTYEEGSAVNLRTSGHTGYVFKGWYDGETQLSSATSFNYTMPSNDAVVQARYEFDPSVPANPAMPDTTTYYSFTATVSPVGAGTLNTYSGRYAAGATVNMRAYVNTGYQFMGWQDDSGETVATLASFNYTMPRRDVQLTALYVYDPSVPANPDSMATRYTVTVACKPVGGGTFNTTSVTQGEGSSVRLYAYTNNGYRFLHWENEQGEVIATAQNFDYIIPHGNSKVFGIFEFDPAPPANPAKNYWNKELGEVIVDDFTTGSLGSAVAQAINGSSANDVAMITVAGVMNNNDFGIANNYSNCTLLDLSRVTGIAAVPSYAFDYTNLESVYLPASIEQIGYRAFYECKQLASVIVYAMTPPALENNVFTGVPEGLVVYVPAAAIAQYQDADGWKDFTILPIQEDIRSITVSLPNGANAKDYSGMWLEMTNTRSGQRMHYVMTDRKEYIFANIIRNTSWNVTLRNERGDVFGQIDNVEVKDEDVAVTFSSLSKPQTLSLQVVVGDASQRRDDVIITWTDTQGNYLAQGATLTGLCLGTTLGYRIQLSQELAMQYETPADGTLTVTAESSLVTVRLQPIGEVTLTGKVKDLATGMALSGATISASQTFGGRYSRTINAKADNKGEYTLSIAAVPTSLAFAAADYISQTLDYSNNEFDELNEFSVPDVLLKSITGATITIGFTYTTVEGETQSWYSDYQNVGFELFNVTKNRAISQYNVQYPQIVLLEEVDDGDVLRLTAYSRVTTNYTNGTNGGAFMPVTTTTTIASQKADATFAITELGRIEAEYTRSGNLNVAASLYDANGKLLKTYDYSNGELTISNLADGQYILVSMGSSQFFNSIYDLSQLPQTGLVKDTDYVQHTVTVKSGQVTNINIDLVPKLDESKLYYTGSGTSFTVNKPSIVAGNYLTLTGRIDFKPAYATTVSNVQMIVDLPESCQFVENSVMVGNSTSTYTLNGHQLIIPMARYTDRVRFCVIPTLGGEYAPSAFVQFDLNGKTVTQPIGSANYTAKDLSISVPSTVAKTSVPVSGSAIGQSQVEIYDNGVLIGQTTSLANGTWATTCELNEPYNLSTHSIYAHVTTKAGLELQSETMDCLYDMNAIQVSKVIMYHDNPEQRKTYEVVFDFLNPSGKASTYVYYIYNKEFTFTIDFTNNDPEKVSNVVLYVKTGNDGKWTPLRPTYDEKKGMWVASGQFGNMYDGNIPVNVKVSYDVDSEPVLDAGMFDDMFNLKEGIQEIIDEEDPELDDVIARYDAAIEADNEELAAELLQELVALMGVSKGDEENTVVDLEQLLMLQTQAQIATDSILTVLDNFSQQSIYAQDIISQYMEGVTIEHAPNLTPDQLLASGYEAINKTDGTILYILFTGNDIHCIDFSADIHLIVAGDIVAASRGLRKLSGRDMLEKIRQLALEIGDWCEKILGAFDSCLTLIDEAISANNKLIGAAWTTLDANKNLSKSEIKALEKVVSITSKNNKGLRKLKKVLEDKVGPFLGKGTQKAFQIFALVADAWDCYKKLDKLLKLYESISVPCPEAGNAAVSLINDVDYYINEIGACYIGKLIADVGELLGIFGGLTSLIPSGGSSLTVILASVAVLAANIGVNVLIDWRYDKKYTRFCKEYRELYTMCGLEPCNGATPCPPGSDDEDGNDAQESGDPDSTPQIDPSGFVYEGVTSNRVEGATATVYYKETVEDMYGDLHENIVKWDAEEFAQENPLFTDENGYYRWDVPQGLWQVKFEKEGYETTYSEWLPVPPPQLDVNIAMKQNVQPEVKAARAYEDAVEVEFDKYMMTELLTAENISVMAGGKAVEGNVELLNEERAGTGPAPTETFASKIRFNAKQPFTEQEITLMVSNRVRSYADIRMQNDYQQKFTIEQEIKQILSDSLTVVGYGEKATLTVSVLPVSASKGKMLNVKTSSPMILGVETEQVVIGNDGKAKVTLSGELPGVAALTFSVEGTDKTAITIASVEQKETIVGDANGDGAIDVRDMSVVLAAILAGTQDQFVAVADMNGDGTVDVRDLSLMLSLILGK